MRPGQAEYITALAGRLGQACDLAPVGAVAARYEGSRLLADCPFCRGAELVDKTERLFFCFSCGMVANGGHVMTATLPETD